jgi:hypothetical protein
MLRIRALARVRLRKHLNEAGPLERRPPKMQDRPRVGYLGWTGEEAAQTAIRPQAVVHAPHNLNTRHWAAPLRPQHRGHVRVKPQRLLDHAHVLVRGLVRALEEAQPRRELREWDEENPPPGPPPGLRGPLAAEAGPNARTDIRSEGRIGGWREGSLLGGRIFGDELHDGSAHPQFEVEGLEVCGVEDLRLAAP